MPMPSANRQAPGAPSNKNPGTMDNTGPFSPAPKQLDVARHSESDPAAWMSGELETGTGADKAKNWSGQ